MTKSNESQTTGNALAPVSPDKRRARRLRFTSLAILLLGVVGAGAIDWIGSRSRDYMDDPAMLRFDQAEVRQMGMLYGKQGVMIHEFYAALERPRVQATIVLAVAVMLAGGCWYFARLFDNGGNEN